MTPRRLIALAVATPTAIFWLVAACTNLQPLSSSVCGNSIIEPDSGEQCDKFDLVPPGTDALYHCFQPDAGSAACHIMCGPGNVCPRGWGCGADNVCRQPLGGFNAPGQPIPTDVRSLALADFNGDRRLDVVARGTGSASVAYFDALGNLVTTNTLDVARGRIAQGDLTGSGLADLIVLDSVISRSQGISIQLGTGVDLWQGQTTRTLATTLFASFPLPNTREAQFLPAALGLSSSTALQDDLLIFTRSVGDGGTASVLGVVQPQGGVSVLAVIPGALAPYGQLPVARINKSVPCDSVVLGFVTDDKATVYQTCAKLDGGAITLNAFGVAVPPTVVTFGKAIVGPLLVVDENNDGNLDIVTAFPRDATQLQWDVVVAHGDGAGGFAAVAAAVQSPVLRGFPLAAGFIDGDNLLDYVDASEVVLSTSFARIPTTGGLTDASIRDLNNDKKVDLVGVAPSGIDFFSGTGSALMNHRFYDMPSASVLTVGDIDGDFNEDVIVASNTQPSVLSVLYGQTAAYPQAAVTIGTVPAAQHLAAGRLTWFFGDPPDAIDSVVVTQRDPLVPDQLAVVIVQGRSDRQPLSPLLLNRFRVSADSGAPADVPVAAAIGNVSRSVDAATYDASLVVLGSANPPPDAAFALQLWTLPTTTTNTILSTSTIIVPNASSATVFGNRNTHAAGLAAIDLDPSKNNGDEIVLAIASTEGPPDGLFCVFASDPSTNAWSTKQNDTFDGRPRLVRASEVPVRLLPADFDGDGLQDLLVVYGASAPLGSDNSPVLARVIFNDGTGSMRWVNASKAVEVRLPPDAAGVAPINLLGNGAMQLAIVTTDGTVSFAEVATSSDASSPIASAGSIPGVFVPGSVVDIVAGDVNGDGIDDIVVAAATTLSVFLGKALVQ